MTNAEQNSFVLATAVPGFIKIGKTGLDNFEQYMYHIKLRKEWLFQCNGSEVKVFH